MDWEIYYQIASNKATLYSKISMVTELAVLMIRTTISENCDHHVYGNRLTGKTMEPRRP